MDMENIALFDMDGTLCNYDLELKREMNKLKAPEEKPFSPPLPNSAPDYIKERANLIRSRESWWENLPKLRLGWDILEIAKELEYRIMILTQGPRNNPASWSGKKKWIDKNLGEDVDVTITRDKGLVYGKVLVDDYPKYAERWLEWRPRGLVIMPTGSMNIGYSHPQVIKYDGSEATLAQARKAMEKAKSRNRYKF